MKNFLVLTLFFLSLINTSILANDSKESKKNIKKALKLIKKKDFELAYNLLKKSSQNSLEATYILGKFYLLKNSKYYNKTQAYNTILNAANKNHAKSQLFIGKLFLYGKIVQKDYEKAMYYLKEASKQKLYDSNCYIAYMYASGKGVFPNFGRAHAFAKDEYKRGNKLCKKIWRDYNLSKYPKDKSWKIGDYLSPAK